MNMYGEEVRGLKDRIRELQKAAKHEEKSSKKQQEYLVTLEQKYREICEKAGVSSSMNHTRAEDQKQFNIQFKPRAGNALNKDLRKSMPLSTKNKAQATEEDEGEEKIEVFTFLIAVL